MSMAPGDSACAADTHLAVEALSLPSRCSATIRTLLMDDPCNVGRVLTRHWKFQNGRGENLRPAAGRDPYRRPFCFSAATSSRSAEHTSELQSLMRISYAVFFLKTIKYKILHTSYKLTR